ncbi:MAG TPA: winged helix-turn-helix domain-containing protein [Pyrinomonadaceae bacterium]|jgi:DNA-binding winged helix-turn-helix (wHTH) protein/TolB-like protein
MPDEVYEFDSYRLEVASRRLLRNGEPIALSSRAFDLLVELVKRNNQIVSQEDLINAVWQEQAVAPNNLSQAVKQIRCALEDTGKQHRYLITVPRQGFKFVLREENKFVPPEEEREENNLSPPGEPSFEPNKIVSEQSPLADDIHASLPSENKKSEFDKSEGKEKSFWLPAAAICLIAIGGIAALYFWQMNRAKSALGVKTIAVLPFQPMTVQAENDDALRMGMTDALIMRLSRIKEITVLPTAIVSRFNKSDLDPLAAGRELNADAVLDGRVQRSGEQVRATVQLIRTTDGKTLWSDVFINEFNGIFGIQDSISLKIADTLELELSDDERRKIMKSYTSSAQAYRLYLDAFHLFTNQSSLEARTEAEKKFRQAIELDPKFALAYLGLANLQIEKPSPEGYRKMRLLAQQAIELDDALGNAYATRAFATWRGDWNWVDAEKDFKRAIELRNVNRLTHLWYSLLLSGMERHDEALTILNLSPFKEYNRPWGTFSIYFFNRNYDRTIEEAKFWLEKRPNNLQALPMLARAYTEKGMFKEAIEIWEKTVALHEILPQTTLCELGFTYARAGRKDKAREILEKARKLSAEKPDTLDYGSFAVLYGALGEKDSAFENLEKSIEKRESWGYMLKVNPQFDSLRDDPRFEKMLRKVNLAP